MWRIFVSFIQQLVLSFFAWIFDRHEDPPQVSEKRRELVDTIPSNASVLEVGAGTGSTLDSAAYDGAAGRFSSLTMAEPDSGMRSRLEAKLRTRRSAVAATEANIVDGALPKLPFEDGTFEAVVYFFVHSHVEDRPSAVREIVRVLAPGGKLLFMDHGAHAGPHGHGHGHGHAHGGHHHAHPRPFVFEWLKFLNIRRRREDLSLDLVLKELKEDPSLNELFESRMEVDSVMKEVCYGCYEKRPDPDS
ncbi:methyltransferase [Gracilaria domingensis]|nr:methyltransferase [Gracilaria domingensis]